MNQQKPTTRLSQSVGRTVRESKVREPAVTQVDRDIGKINNGRNRGIIDQVSSIHTAKRPITRFLTAGRSRGRRAVDYSSGTQDDVTRSVLPKVIKFNVVDTRSGEILSLEDSTIREVYYSAQDAHTWLLDSGATFHITPNIEWFSNYLAGTQFDSVMGRTAKSPEPEKFPAPRTGPQRHVDRCPKCH